MEHDYDYHAAWAHAMTNGAIASHLHMLVTDIRRLTPKERNALLNEAARRLEVK